MVVITFRENRDEVVADLRGWGIVHHEVICATTEAVLAAGPIVLEPIVNIDINTPEAYVGDLASDLSGRRGQVTGTDAASDAISITGQVPLSELGDYASRLKSVTGGAGAYQIEFSHYAPVPPQVQTQLAAQYRRKEED